MKSYCSAILPKNYSLSWWCTISTLLPADGNHPLRSPYNEAANSEGIFFMHPSPFCLVLRRYGEIWRQGGGVGGMWWMVLFSTLVIGWCVAISRYLTAPSPAHHSNYNTPTLQNVNGIVKTCPLRHVCSATQRKAIHWVWGLRQI